VITLSQLSNAMGVNSVRALPWLAPLNDAMAEFGINTPAQVAAFLAQVGHESGRLVYVKEIWGPTQCPWQAKYEGRKDLGNIQVGDGKRYMGRGLIQITGRANYQECSKALGIDFEANPEMLEQPRYAARSAAWFWDSHGCATPAEAGNIRAVTRIINGGYNGLDDRIALFNKAKLALADNQSTIA
jgi:putative chitinase